jgi:hypothetical protein
MRSGKRWLELINVELLVGSTASSFAPASPSVRRRTEDSAGPEHEARCRLGRIPTGPSPVASPCGSCRNVCGPGSITYVAAIYMRLTALYILRRHPRSHDELCARNSLGVMQSARPMSSIRSAFTRVPRPRSCSSLPSSAARSRLLLMGAQPMHGMSSQSCYSRRALAARSRWKRLVQMNASP